MFIVILIAVGCVWQAVSWSYRAELVKLQQTGEERLALYTGTLNSLLTRMENLPYVMAHNDAVARLLLHQDNLDQLNRDLESLNYWAGTDSLYVMDNEGNIVASSTWREPVNLIGSNYAFRPYFNSAKEGEQGRLFAIGLESNQPGLFMSHGVFREGRFLGVVVVEAALDPLIEDWREGGENLLISDANDVVILASNSAWTFTSLKPLDPEQRALLSSSLLYSDQPLSQTPLEFGIELEEGGRLVRADNNRYLMVSQQNPQLGWTLSYLAPLTGVVQQTRSVLIIGTVLALLVLAVAMYSRERRQKKLSRKKLKEAEIIKQINLRLQEEIEEHRRTEQALRDAQTELVQSSKLAAVGQMAAGIVHELNQPIAAIRTHAASGRLLLEREQPEKLRETLAAVTRITEHMASITAQLKIFARKVPKKKEKVLVENCLDAAMNMLQPLLDEADVRLQKQICDEPLYIRGSQVQLEQVLVNLVRNGVDAMQQSADKSLQIVLKRKEQRLELQVLDSGSGIAEEHLDELFNPFFTTKEVGQGMGLGLSICYRIVSDLGGSIRAENNPQGGAIFSVSLPLIEETGAKDD
ncbi:two-component system, NtrC family, C4-dicarboxylate transport sensor histidine kinase DctB [Malonomonas rubra DSM 5091]|uniref:C4-dicarboxylate transport sensor protein DctB n=1 Tax=Malonomonas rubra DSM 5091 TaxID=1122189 RepID=A0A1M6IXZ2_MALRU|nr:ATP-binding protein [Malonomonas rubra]SHJ39343.1 two-component system, NtrC family, C4-dicarboxylate transport sensor histidine kinase DctB [Malonomonas rubra DSM 5091]